MVDFSWMGPEDDLDGAESLSARLTKVLGPTEYLLWADRPLLPLPIRLPLIPALFVSVIAGLSGFSLAAMFGLVGQEWMDIRLILLALGLGPAVLGGMIMTQLICLGIRRWLRRRWLARLVYAVTSDRAIVAQVEPLAGLVESQSLWHGEASDTRRFENPDGSGDLYFLGLDGEDWIPFQFHEVPRVGFVEALVRESLIGGEQDWWKGGSIGAC